MFTTQDAETLLTIHRLRAAELRAEAAADRLARSVPHRSGAGSADRPRSRLGRHGPGHARATALP